MGLIVCGAFVDCLLSSDKAALPALVLRDLGKGLNPSPDWDKQ